MAVKKAKSPKKGKRSGEPKVPRALNAKQLHFVAQYIQHGNATQAAIEAGYSAKTASQIGYQLLQNPSVKAAITDIKARALEEAGVNAYRVLSEYARLAFGDFRSLVNWDGEGNAWFTPSENLTDADAAMVASLTHTVTMIPQKNAEPIEKRQVSIKRYDKKAALDKLFEHLGLGKKDGAIALEAVEAYVEALGEQVFEAARETITDENSLGALLAALERRFGALPFDTKPRTQRTS